MSKVVEWKEKIDPLLSEVEDLIHQLPQKGDKSEDCQRIQLQYELNQLQMAVNGTEEIDFKY